MRPSYARFRSQLLLALAATLVATSLAACGGSDDDGAPRNLNNDESFRERERRLSTTLTTGANPCYLDGDTAVCWGFSGQGYLDKDRPNHSYNLDYDERIRLDVNDVAGVESGDDFLCLRLSNGTARCWGSNVSGQLGNGQTTPQQDQYIRQPVEVDGLSDAVKLEIGNRHGCALVSDGTVDCWGSNQDGQLGTDSVSEDGHAPLEVDGINNAIDLATGARHSCALLDTGEVRCWGQDFNGELGNNEASEASSTPVKVKGLDNVVDLASHPEGNHTCAAHTDGTVHCWGKARSGQLGNDGDASTYIPTPVQVQQIDNAAAVMVGSSHSCAINPDGSVRCWGNNSRGELGADTSDSSSQQPVDVPGLQNAAAGDGTCVKTTEERLKCWGYSYGTDQSPIQTLFSP
jgi:alpha-tubulin suppressor-like RCC1 family protein